MTLEELAENQSKVLVKIQDDLARTQAMLEVLIKAEIERVSDRFKAKEDEDPYLKKIDIGEIMKMVDGDVDSHYRKHQKLIQTFSS